MKHKRPPIPIIIVVVLVLLVAGYFGLRALRSSASTSLTASGTIEAVQVTVSPELAGKVAKVFVDEGATVKAGEVLFQLDDTLLQAQRKVTLAALDSAKAASATADGARATAQANLELVQAAARLEAVSTRTASWWLTQPEDYLLPGWFFTQDEAISAAQAELDAASTARDDAQTRLADDQGQDQAADFLAAEKRLNGAHASFLVAEDVLNRTRLARDNADLQEAAQKTFDRAKSELEAAQSAYDELKGTGAAKNIIVARAELAAAQERYETARDRLQALQTGENSPKFAVARASLEQAGLAAEQAAQAVTQAQANLSLLDVQIARLAVTSPTAGVVLTRSVEPGEVLPAGAAAFSLGRLDHLTITVYVPEDRYGEIKLGQTADVTVDPFPGQVFTATVSHIADQAEFTPRNVQTVSGRKSTVFAIRLQVNDPAGKLKPGMPADVAFK